MQRLMWLCWLSLVLSGCSESVIGNEKERAPVPEDTRPVITVTIEPELAYTDTVLTAVVTADEGTDPLTYTFVWTNGTTALTETGDTLDGSVWFDKHDILTVQVIANDGREDSLPAVSSEVVVLNSPPTAPSLMLNPTDPDGGYHNLQCIVDEESVDADGDSIIYTMSWAVDGVPHATPETTDRPNDTVAGADTAGDETWECTAVPHDGEEDGVPGTAKVTVDYCSTGSEPWCPGTSCLDILTKEASSADGTYWIDPDKTGAFEAYCLMSASFDGGGWTLIAVSSDDGVDSWTWNNRDYLTTDTTTFGTVAARNLDFKSPALHRLSATDMLFIHQPSGVWAGYNHVGSGSESFADVVSGEGSNCYSQTGRGYPKSSGTLTLSGKMCSTDLYFNSEDHDGRTNPTGGQCTQASYSDDTWGPAWNIQNNNGCAHDDPAGASLGPNRSSPSDEISLANPSTEQLKAGFGWALSVNTGASGTGANYFQVYVRE